MCIYCIEFIRTHIITVIWPKFVSFQIGCSKIHQNPFIIVFPMKLAILGTLRTLKRLPHFRRRPWFEDLAGLAQSWRNLKKAEEKSISLAILATSVNASRNLLFFLLYVISLVFQKSMSEIFRNGDGKWNMYHPSFPVKLSTYWQSFFTFIGRRKAKRSLVLQGDDKRTLVVQMAKCVSSTTWYVYVV